MIRIKSPKANNQQYNNNMLKGLKWLVFALLVFGVVSQVNSQAKTSKGPAAATKAAPAAAKAPSGKPAKTGDEDGFDTAPGGNEVAIEEGAPIQAKPVKKDPAKLIEEIKENMTLDLGESTGKDWGDLSSAILGAAWSNNGNKTEISVLELMKWFDNVGGEERLHLLRILELMDKNMNGLISKDEFISLYAGAMASPDKAIEILHRIQDYDGNGHITLWETLTEVLTVDGINRNIYDKFRESAYANRKMDANFDMSVNLHEFTNYMVWQMNKGLHSVAEGHKPLHPITIGPVTGAP